MFKFPVSIFPYHLWKFSVCFEASFTFAWGTCEFERTSQDVTKRHLFQLYVIGGLALDGMANDVQVARLISPSERSSKRIFLTFHPPINAFLDIYRTTQSRRTGIRPYNMFPDYLLSMSVFRLTACSVLPLSWHQADDVDDAGFHVRSFHIA